MNRVVVLIALTAGALLTACGGGGSTGSSAGGPTVVPLTMTEFKIDSPQTTFKVGVPYRFVVSNKGTMPHDFSITPPVTGDMAGMTAEQMHQNALAVINAQDMPPGATKTVDVTFSKPYSSSEIEFACHTPGHYEAGMKTPFTVT